jgi:recombination protein RecT
MSSEIKVAGKPKGITTIGEYLKNPSNIDKIQKIVAAGLDAEKLVTVALSIIAGSEKLQKCDAMSVYTAVHQAAQLGLSFEPALGQAYLVPYGSKATLIVGYRGMIALTRRSGAVLSVSARVVHKADFFKFVQGTEEKIEHIPALVDDPGPVVAAYAVVHLKDGGMQFEVMSASQIDAVRARSMASGSGPWVTDTTEMQRKTVLRRALKHVTMSTDVAEALDRAEREERERDVTPKRPTLTVVEDTTPDAPSEELPPHDAVTGVASEPVAAPVQAPAPTVEKKPARAPRGVEVSDPQTEALILDAITTAEGDEDLKDAMDRFEAAKGRLSAQQQKNILDAAELAGWKG